MKNLLPGVSSVFRWATVAGILCFAARCGAQDNVWTGTASGNWHDLSWSLGTLPATNQTIWLTNYGWKAVEINAATAQHFPQSLNVDSINISSPTNSFNTLLLNSAGSGTPLTVKTLTVASNSAVTMFSSALQINGPNGSGMAVGGKFDQNDSVVAGNQVNVGYIGSGVYNFNSGYFTVSHLWLGGGGNPGVFNQSGGTNGFGITHLDGGTYVLSNGFYGAATYFDGGTFVQRGGFLNTNLTIFNGSYLLEDGINQSDITVSVSDGWTSGRGGMLQSGGTNYGALNIGSYGYGVYTLSNGISLPKGLTVGYKGSYNQWGGTQSVPGPISVQEQQIAANAFEEGFFYLYGGQISSAGMLLGGYYAQTGGTNLVAGDVTMFAVGTWLVLSGGLLTANNLTANPASEGYLRLDGGTLVVTNQLKVAGNSYPAGWAGFLGGGQLIVSNIYLAPYGSFACRDGVITQSGTLTMANAKLYSGTHSVQLGPLCLVSGSDTNSTLYLVSPTSIVNFADSSSITWSNEPMLTVEGWTGSLFGGGQQQIIFGKSSSALTHAQLGQIQFHNPAGLADGTYPARILPSGEIVPASSSALPASMSLSPQPGGMQVMLQAETGHVYCIETSTDLVHWGTWTIQTNSTGTITITDTDATNYPMRFYRARLMP